MVQVQREPLKKQILRKGEDAIRTRRARTEGGAIPVIIALLSMSRIRDKRKESLKKKLMEMSAHKKRTG